MKNVLIIGAHYDDAELGVGGTAARLAAEGKNVYKLTLTNNVTKSQILHVNVEYEASLQCSKAACEILGIHEITEFEPEECSHLEYNTELMQRIEEVIFKYKIDTCFIHYVDDLNRDHIAANQLSVTAARHCKTVLAYQSNGYILPTTYYPTLFFDVSGEYIEKKKKALNQYEGDHNRFNRLFETVIDRNRIWGYPNECEYAEGFHVIKMLV